MAANAGDHRKISNNAVGINIIAISRNRDESGAEGSIAVEIVDFVNAAMDSSQSTLGTFGAQEDMNGSGRRTLTSTLRMATFHTIVNKVAASLEMESSASSTKIDTGMVAPLAVTVGLLERLGGMHACMHACIIIVPLADWFWFRFKFGILAS